MAHDSYAKTKRDGKSVDDKTTLIYNDRITLTGIPLEAYDYVVTVSLETMKIGQALPPLAL